MWGIDSSRSITEALTVKQVIFDLFSERLINIIVDLIELRVMRVKLTSLLFLLLFTAALSACGNKGPLTLPDEEKKTQQEG